MRTTLQLVAILAALLLLPISCQDLFRQTQTGILLISLQAPRNLRRLCVARKPLEERLAAVVVAHSEDDLDSRVL